MSTQKVFLADSISLAHVSSSRLERSQIQATSRRSLMRVLDFGMPCKSASGMDVQGLYSDEAPKLDRFLVLCWRQRLKHESLQRSFSSFKVSSFGAKTDTRFTESLDL